MDNTPQNITILSLNFNFSLSFYTMLYPNHTINKHGLILGKSVHSGFISGVKYSTML